MEKWLEELLYPHGRVIGNTVILKHDDLTDEKGREGKLYVRKDGSFWKVEYVSFEGGKCEEGCTALSKRDLQLTTYSISSLPEIERK